MRLESGIFLLVTFHVLLDHGFASTGSGQNTKRYEPTWESLDQRPLPTWYDEAKIGIFIHWGVYSVPAFHSEWFWFYWRNQSSPDVVDFMNKNYPKNFIYADFASSFKAELWNPEHWAKLFALSGAKYVVLTSKHHDGYALWPSSVGFNWNSMDVGPNRDLVGDLSKTVLAEGLRFGLYHSLFEWFNPLYLDDVANNFTTDRYVRVKALPEMFELVKKYKPDVIWSDGDWGGNSSYWKSREFLAWLFNDSPNHDSVVVNDRWGADANCKHGSFLNCMDRFDPKVPPSKKWENAMTLDRKSWGWRREATYEDFYKFDELLKLLIRTVSRGGNLLLNIGPNSDGTISPIFEERLTQLGDWLKYRGRAVYKTTPGPYISEDILTTKTNNSTYLFLLNQPWDSVTKSITIRSDNLKHTREVRILNRYNVKLAFKYTKNGCLTISLPDDIITEMVPVIEIDQYSNI